MTNSDSLLDEWQKRLAESEARLGEPSSLTWYFEIQARILKFMIRRYGERNLSIVRGEGTRRSETVASIPYFAPLPKTSRKIKRHAEIASALRRISRVNYQLSLRAED